MQSVRFEQLRVITILFPISNLVPSLRFRSATLLFCLLFQDVYPALLLSLFSQMFYVSKYGFFSLFGVEIFFPVLGSSGLASVYGNSGVLTQ